MTEHKHISIICDGCEKELITHDPVPNYTFQLKAINTNIPNPFEIAAVLVSPPIAHDHHFCNLGCMLYWITTTMKENPGIPEEYKHNLVELMKEKI